MPIARSWGAARARSSIESWIPAADDDRAWAARDQFVLSKYR